MWRGTPAWPNYGLDGSFYYTRQDIDVQHKAIDEVWRKKMVEFVFAYNREEFLKKYRERNEMPDEMWGFLKPHIAMAWRCGWTNCVNAVSQKVREQNGELYAHIKDGGGMTYEEYLAAYYNLAGNELLDYEEVPDYSTLSEEQQETLDTLEETRADRDTRIFWQQWEMENGRTWDE